MAQTHTHPLPATLSARGPNFALNLLGAALGFFMPLVAALVFPTYMHQMPHPGWEWARLLELPFVFFEIGVIMWATHVGCDRSELWRALPRDVRLSALLLLAAMVISSIFIAERLAAALTMSLIYAIHGLFAIAVYQLLSKFSPRDAGGFLNWHAAGLAMLALYTGWWFSFPPPASQVMGGVIEWGSALPGFINVRHFGAWTGAIATGFAVKILFEPRQRKWQLDDALYVLAAAMTVWSGTRAAVLAIVVVVPIMAMLLLRLPAWTAIGRAALLTGLALLLTWLLLWPDPDFHLFVVGEYSSISSAGSSRLDLWAKGIELWLQSPALGLGTGSFFWEGKPWSHTQPHNVIVQYLVSWGLIGAVAALWLVGRGIHAAHRAGLAHLQLLPILAVMNALLFQSLFEGMLHYPRFIISIIVCGVAVIVLARQEVADTRTA